MHQFVIMNRGQNMPKAFRPDIQRAPDAFRPDSFAGMHREPEPCVARFAIHVAKELSCSIALVAADPDADDAGIFVLHLGSLAKDARRSFDSKMPHRVEDPVERNAEAFLGLFPRPLHCREYRLKIAALPVIDKTHCDICLGVDYALRSKLL